MTGKNNKRRAGKIVLVTILAIIMLIAIVPLAALATGGESVSCTHAHTEECYAAPEGHVHSEAEGCVPTYPTKTVVVSAGHTHTEACYSVETVTGENGEASEVQTPTCGLEPAPDVTEEVPDTDAEPVSWVCGAEALVCEHRDCTAESCAVAQSESGLPSSGVEADAPQSSPQRSPRAGGTGLITVAAAPSTNSYRTWTDPGNNVAPTDLVVTLTVTLTQPNIADGTVELPLGYFPTAASFTQWDDFFTFDGTSLDSYVANPDSMLESYEVVGDNNATGQNAGANLKLVLHLKDGQPAGQEAFSIRFAYNQAAYLTSTGFGKVPSGTTLWDIEPSAYVDTVLSDTAAASSVKTSATTALSPYTTYFVPTTQNYSGGMVTNRSGIYYSG